MHLNTFSMHLNTFSMHLNTFSMNLNTFSMTTCSGKSNLALYILSYLSKTSQQNSYVIFELEIALPDGKLSLKNKSSKNFSSLLLADAL